MSVLSRAEATAAAQVSAFRVRVTSALAEVAREVHGGHTPPYSQEKYDARARLAAAVLKNPVGYAPVFALAVASNEFPGPGNNPACVPGAGDGSNPLLTVGMVPIEDPTTQQIADADTALRAGIGYVWDAVAAAPEVVA